MASVIVYLRDEERDALVKLAQREYRTPKAQAAVIIRNELTQLGLVDTSSEGPTEKHKEASHGDQLTC
jgi:hypothetical protein